jgi:hypothetical protein
MTNIPDVEKCVSFCVDVGRIVKSASRIILKLGARVHVASYMLLSLFNDENHLSDCSDFDFAFEINIAFANSYFRSVYDFILQYPATTFTSSSLCISAIRAHFPLKSLSINNFANRAISILLAKVNNCTFPPRINN